MKKILSFLTILALLSTSTTNLVSCSFTTGTTAETPIAPPIAPIAPTIAPIYPSRKYGINYTFKGTWAAKSSFTINLNSSSPSGFYLETGDKIDMTWYWNGSPASYPNCTIHLGTPYRPGSSGTWEITFNANSLNVTSLRNNSNKFIIRLNTPTSSVFKI